MIAGGTSYEGMRVVSPDGDGVIAKVLNPDLVLVELTSREKIMHPKTKEMVYPQGRFDLSELKAIDKPRPLPGSPELEGERQLQQGLTSEPAASVPDAPPVDTPPVENTAGATA